jgi:hypothetical protein
MKSKNQKHDVFGNIPNISKTLFLFCLFGFLVFLGTSQVVFAEKIIQNNFQVFEKFDCPQWYPPSLDWCKNGKIISRGRDKNGCPISPKCITQSIKVLSPNGGEYWIKRHTYMIKWRATSIDKVDITLMRSPPKCVGNAGIGCPQVIFPEIAMTIAKNICNTGIYYWKVPSSIGTSDRFRIKVSNAANNEIFDISDDYFSIIEFTPKQKFYRVTLHANPKVIPADGISTSTITAQIIPFLGIPKPLDKPTEVYHSTQPNLGGIRINFETTHGTLSATQVTTDKNGRATVTLTSEKSDNLLRARIKATSRNIIKGGETFVIFEPLPYSLCAKEWEHFSKVFTDKYPKKCCEGLTEWMSGMDTRKVIDNKCVKTHALRGWPVGTCINCGNGICESIENICNCPQDCSSSNSDQDQDCIDRVNEYFDSSGSGAPPGSKHACCNSNDYCVTADGKCKEPNKVHCGNWLCLSGKWDRCDSESEGIKRGNWKCSNGKWYYEKVVL